MRIGLCLYTKGTNNWSLRHWRGVIGKAHADIHKKLLGPSLLMSLALSVDGRTADSDFPNLLLHKEREPFGL